MQSLDPEALMDDAIRVAGGRRVRELVGPSPPFDNADYLFPSDNVVAELKSFEKDFLSDSTVTEKMHILYNRWFNEGRGIPFILGSGVLRTDQLPLECARELVGIFKDRIESTVLRKANRQIRETKENLNRPDSVGLLLLSNEGNFALDPAMMAHVLFHSLRAKYSSIEHVILFSANLAVGDLAGPINGPPFFSIRFPGRRRPSDAFLQRLGSDWYQILSAATNRQFPPFGFTEPGLTEIDRLRFRPKP
jgi:hypothetical protein